MKNFISTDSSAFSFDELAALAINDPSAFEELRSVLIKDTIQLSGNSNLLSRLQRRLDEETDNGTPRHLSFLYFSNWLSDTYSKLN